MFKNTALLMALTSAVLLAACGGGGGSTDVTTASASIAPQFHASVQPAVSGASGYRGTLSPSDLINHYNIINNYNGAGKPLPSWMQ